MKLDDVPREQLQHALLRAYYNWDRLNELFFIDLNRPLAAVTAPGPMPTVITAVIQAASAEGWLEELVTKAWQKFPNNPELRSLVQGGGGIGTPLQGIADWRSQAELLVSSAEKLKARPDPTISPASSGLDDRIRAVLRPLMATEQSRQARLSRAFLHPGLLDRVATGGETGVFLSLLLQTLRDYGEVEHGMPALRALLESVKEEVGVSDRERIEEILRAHPR